MRRARDSRGFTLLEIIVSLAVAALGIAAVAKATGDAATVTAETRERMLAVWVSSNRLAELKITRAWPPPGQYDSTSTMGGRTWYLTQVVSGTDIDALRRVDIEVYLDVDREQSEYQTFGYLARYESPQDPEGETGGEEVDGQDEEGLEEIPLPGDEEPETEAEAEPETEPETEAQADTEPDDETNGDNDQ